MKRSGDEEIGMKEYEQQSHNDSAHIHGKKVFWE